MKHKNQNTFGCIKQYTQCIEWNLGDIPCLDIKNGDTLDLLTFAIVNKLCELSIPLDLSKVSIQCIIDKLGATEPLTKTITSYLQLVIDNECKLKDLIDLVNARIDGIATGIVVDLKCLATLDAFGNPIPYTEQTVFQLLINNSCTLKTQVASLFLSITNLQNQLNNLPAAYTEPLLTTCIFTSKTTSQGVVLLASDYCAYKIKVGTDAEISTAIGRQCSTLNVDFVSNPNFIQAPTSLADSVNNMWILACDQYTRLKALEACACKFTCKDITIGFITTFNTGDTVTLKFTSGAGTSIPVGFTNCGSMLTIKNDKGVTTAAIPVIIAQEGESIPIDISMFNNGEYLTFNLDAHLCGNGITCEKCISKVVRNTSGCCAITNTGIVPTTIIYKTCGLSV